MLLLATVRVASAEVVRIEVLQRDAFGSHNRVIGRVHFAVKPDAPANRGIADIALAPRNANGLVEFSSDLLWFEPRDAAKARGTVFLEVVNRGRDQSLAIMSGGRTRDFEPAEWDMGDRFLLDQGFTVAFLGWQFDVQPDQGLTFQAPVADVEGVVRASYIEDGVGQRTRGFRVTYCAAAPTQADATLTMRGAIDDATSGAARSVAVHVGRLRRDLARRIRGRALRSGVSREGFGRGRAGPRRPSRLRLVPEDGGT